jgi:hypothetical protein
MKTMIQHRIHTLALAVAGLCMALSAQAQTASSSGGTGTGAASTGTSAATSADPQTKAPEAPAAPVDGGFMGGLFGAPGVSGGLNQMSVTPSYELTGVQRAASNEPSILTAPADGTPIKFENGIYVYAAGRAGFGHNSNLTGVSTGVVSSSLYSLQPDLVAELKNRGDRYTLHYSGNYTHYFSSGNDDFKHHNLNASGDNYFSSRSRVGWDVGYIERTDPRGSTNVAGGNTPNRWTGPSARALYTYGAKDAQGRLEVEGNYLSKKYQNNLASTAVLNNDTTSGSGRFFYRVMPRTSAVIELRQAHASYGNNPGYSSNETRVYAGVTWDATAKTSGSFKVGSARKSFSDSVTYGKPTGNSWEGNVRWSPLTYSTIDLVSNRGFADATGLGRYLLNTGNSISWNHQWSNSLNSRASLGTLRTDFVGAGRTDNTDNAGIGVFYEVSRNWRAGAEWAYTKRKSNQAAFEFTRNTTFFSLQGTL